MPADGGSLAALLVFQPSMFLHGALWQPFTYSLIHFGILGTLFELLSLWFLAGFLEDMHNPAWVTGLYAASVFGTAARWQFTLLRHAPHSTPELPLYGCFGGIFGLLVAIGVLYGEMEFLLFFTIGIKARYLAVIYALIAIAMLFGAAAHVRLCPAGRRAGRPALYPLAPRRGISFCLQRAVVRPAQPLLPLEAPPRRPQVRGLHALAGPHRRASTARAGRSTTIRTTVPLELAP